MKQYSNILVVRTDRIGDVILTTPALAALRKGYPRSKISIMVAPATRDIVEGNPNVDEVIVYDKWGKDRGFFKFWKFIIKLIKKEFDLAIVFHAKQRTNVVCFHAGIPNRIGYRDNSKYGFFLTQGIKDIRPQGKMHESQYCLDILKHLGVEADDYTNLYMPIREDSERWADKLLTDNKIDTNIPLIAIHPGGSDNTKRWPKERFSELMNLLYEKYSLNIVLIGGPENEDIAKEIIQSVDRPILDVIGKTSISQLASLLKRCQILVSSDSGPVHVACAVNTPVVSIFGRRRRGLSHIRWRPLGPRDIALHKDEGCEVCEESVLEACPNCLESIQAKEVLGAIGLVISI